MNFGCIVLYEFRISCSFLAFVEVLVSAAAIPLDKFDQKILAALQINARATHVELAEKVHLSAPQCLRRVRALEERGVIRGYVALAEPAAVGLGVMAFVSLTIDRSQSKRVRQLEPELAKFSEIVECYTVSGESDYLLRVVAPDLLGLSEFLTDRLLQVPGVASCHSMICMEEIKPLSPLPLDWAG
jgi:Lrp/AsnC family transcriptional regulator, leucine-responsive regulatory protein